MTIFSFRYHTEWSSLDLTDFESVAQSEIRGAAECVLPACHVSRPATGRGWGAGEKNSNSGLHHCRPFYSTRILRY